jgi:glycosyltransferase involved in cell wall biosynthesis
MAAADAADRRLPDISVVIPTRNRADLLQLTLRSVLSQQNVSFEVVVVNDGSTDRTVATVEGFDDPRVRLVSHDVSRGVSASRNRGIAEARSAWIAFLDDDDLWAPTKLHEQLRAAHDAGAPWVYTGHVNINILNQVTGGTPPMPPERLAEELPRQNVVPGGCSAVIVSRRALAIAGEFDEELQPLADWDLWLRLAAVGLPASVQRPLVAYRVHGHQMSLHSARVRAEFPVIKARSPEASAAILYRYLGWWSLRVKNHRQALRLFVRAWAEDGSSGRYRQALREIAAVMSDMVKPRLPTLRSHTSAEEGDETLRTWRRQGQAWIDELVHRAHGEVRSGRV